MESRISTSPVLLVQPDMERRSSPLVSTLPFGREFSKHRYDPMLSLGMVVSARSPLPFHLARSLCRSARSMTHRMPAPGSHPGKSQRISCGLPNWRQYQQERAAARPPWLQNSLWCCACNVVNAPSSRLPQKLPKSFIYCFLANQLGASTSHSPDPTLPAPH